MTRRHHLSASTKYKIREKYSNKCAVCGVSVNDVPLEIAHITPLSVGGDVSEENFTLLCPNCHRAFDFHPRGIEFVHFLASLIESNPDFQSVETESKIEGEIRYRADIVAVGKGSGTANKYLIECKSFVTARAFEINRIIDQLKIYRDAKPGYQLVLAVPSTLIDHQANLLRKEGIEVWDLGELVQKFIKQLPNMEASFYKSLFLIHAARSTRTTREQELIDVLDTCTPGRTDCYIYQDLIGEIFEHLFSPPLGRPIGEKPDDAGANRRDYIMANYAESGFWSFMRDKYEADYIVIDAKNYSRKIKKSEILQIANYLKPHGAGRFAIIVSRRGGDSTGCKHTLREQWMLYKKLILVLNDEDVKAMLIAKSDSMNPEIVLGQQIEEFRLSM